jgi:hypothetical protein
MDGFNEANIIQVGTSFLMPNQEYAEQLFFHLHMFTFSTLTYILSVSMCE